MTSTKSPKKSKVSWKTSAQNAPTVFLSDMEKENGTYTPTFDSMPPTIRITNGGRIFSPTPSSKLEKDMRSTSVTAETPSQPSVDTCTKKETRLKSSCGIISRTRNSSLDTRNTNAAYEDKELEKLSTITSSSNPINYQSQSELTWQKRDLLETKHLLDLLETDSPSETPTHGCIKTWYRGRRACGHKDLNDCDNDCNDWWWFHNSNNEWEKYYVK